MPGGHEPRPQPLGRAAAPPAHQAAAKGHTYTVQFKMHSTQKTRVYLKIGHAGPPYREFWKLLFGADREAAGLLGHVHDDAPDDPGVEMAFHVGGQLARLTPRRSRSASTTCASTIRSTRRCRSRCRRRSRTCWSTRSATSPALAKIATVKNPNAVPWELLNAKGEVVANGDDDPVRPRRASGDNVSIADFTAYAREGDRLHAAGRQRRQPPVRHPRRHLRQAEVRRAGVLLPAAQRHPDRDAVRGRPAVGAPGRPRRRQAEQRRQRRAVRARQRLQLQAGRHAAAGTTPATTASTSSTPASRSGRCSTGGSARSAFGGTAPTSPTGR